MGVEDHEPADYRVLVVVEEPAARQMFADLLNGVCHVSLVTTGEDALIKLAERPTDLILLGESLYGTLSREQLLREVQSFESDLPVFAFTRQGEPITAAPGNGITKIFPIRMLKTERGRVQLVLLIERAIAARKKRRQETIRERRSQRAALSAGFFLVGPSDTAARLRQQVYDAGQSDMSLMVTGETGVGKTLIAEGVHKNGIRAMGPLVITEPATIPSTLFAAELFGHTRGAFTGATHSQIGAFEAAHGGTLVLDEIGELQAQLQSQILRVVETKTIRRIGDPREIKLDVRIVTATNRDLEKDVERGVFRRDLFYRLNELHVHIPPLRERREDILPLLQHFIASFSGDPNFECRITDNAMEFLNQYDWPGNVREVRTLARRLVHHGPASLLKREHLQDLFSTRFGPAEASMHLDERIQALKRRLYLNELAKYDYSIREAARGLDMPYTTLRSRLKAMDILKVVNERHQGKKT